VSAFIIGSGTCLPETIVTNDELSPQLGLAPEQIVKSSGIRERRRADSGSTTSSLASEALRIALQNARLGPEQVDYLIFGTMTPDRFIPGSSPSVQAALGLPELPCLDIRAACCNALYGLQLARALIESRTAANVAICLAEIQSRFLSLTPAAGTLSMLFGDGAAALVVSPTKSGEEPALEVLDVLVATDGKYVGDLGIKCPGTEFGTLPAHSLTEFASDYAPHMVGQSVILQAARRMVAGCQALLERNGLGVDDIQWIVPHQANANLLAQVARGLRFSDNDRVISVIGETGNTSSASMGIALDTLRRSGRLNAGDRVLMPAFAAGFTWGAALCQVTD